LDRSLQYGPKLEEPIKANSANLSYLDHEINIAFSAMLQKDVGDRPQVFLHHHYYLVGILYSDFHSSFKHSIIYYYSRSQVISHAKPAQIRAIFSRKDRDDTGQVYHRVYFAIHEYIPSDTNPFATYADFRAAIFHQEPHHVVQVIHATQVHCHANQYVWDKGLVVMRAIDRVSSNFISSTLTQGYCRSIDKHY
jgi:hypothetical protein